MLFLQKILCIEGKMIQYLPDGAITVATAHQRINRALYFLLIKIRIPGGHYFQTVGYDPLVGHKVNFRSLMIKKSRVQWCFLCFVCVYWVVK